jgi:hypothetical protein
MSYLVQRMMDEDDAVAKTHHLMTRVENQAQPYETLDLVLSVMDDGAEDQTSALDEMHFGSEQLSQDRDFDPVFPADLNAEQDEEVSFE